MQVIDLAYLLQQLIVGHWPVLSHKIIQEANSLLHERLIRLLLVVVYRAIKFNGNAD